MPGKKSIVYKGKAAVQAPGDLHAPPKPGRLARTTQAPTTEVVDDYVKVVAAENVARTSDIYLMYERARTRPKLLVQGVQITEICTQVGEGSTALHTPTCSFGSGTLELPK